MSVVVIGLLNARAADTATQAIDASLRSAFDGVPYRLDTALWSEPLALAAPGGATSAGAEVAAPGQLRAQARLTAGAWPAPPRPGGRPGMDSVFGLHHLAHAHNAEVSGDSLAGLDAHGMKDRPAPPGPG